jgi:hypothetical protein
MIYVCDFKLLIFWLILVLVEFEANPCLILFGYIYIYVVVALISIL